MSDNRPVKRRSRVRVTPGSADVAQPTPQQGPQQGPQSRSEPASTPRKHGRRAGGEGADRGLRDLVGAGPSRLGVSGALRGRDVDRPTEEDLAEAERDLRIVRRHWTPGVGS